MRLLRSSLPARMESSCEFITTGATNCAQVSSSACSAAVKLRSSALCTTSTPMANSRSGPGLATSSGAASSERKRSSPVSGK